MSRDNDTSDPRGMSPEVKTESELEIAHVLFIDTVGYSKLLIDEQREVFDAKDFHNGRLILRRGKAFKDSALVELEG